MMGKYMISIDVVARDGVEPPTPAFSGSKLTVIAST
jgi:hypothetical protein